ncbi:helix-turn-helix transcriptional regulator [Eubacterium sp. BX4]|uniref:Helix-turn-helix transcriptional regulator n=1 Tax=Eubacterium segne TaxID=2763045 RepID=A0ABR7F1D4_9FIRM|nr:helix-turn-helix transcriptional regulator [Eubacterium segne]MBC5667388.1 helix-turn-helix transcriptional regulator [Eubacterium segne]
MRYNGDIMEIMKKIEHIKIDENITNKDISEKTGKSKQTVSNLLNGQSKNITLDTLKNLSDAVGYDLIIDFKKK